MTNKEKLELDWLFKRNRRAIIEGPTGKQKIQAVFIGLLFALLIAIGAYFSY